MRTKLLYLLSAIAITSCAHHAGPAPKGAFETNITKDGSKQFAYTLDFKDLPSYQPKNIDPSDRSAARFNDKSYENRADEIKEIMLERLQEQLRHTGFCRDGYFIIEQRVKQKSAYIRGECQDGANDTP